MGFRLNTGSDDMSEFYHLYWVGRESDEQDKECSLNNNKKQRNGTVRAIEKS